MAAIFYLSAQPKLPEIVSGIFVINNEDHTDKVKHFAAYAVLGALVWRALSRHRPRWWQVLVTTAYAVVYGLTDEYHQVFVPGRSFDLLDLSADTLGALAAAGLLTLHKGGDSLGKLRGTREELRSEGQEKVQR